MRRTLINGVIVLALTLVLKPALARAANDPASEVRATIAEASPIFANNSLSPAERELQLRAVAVRHFDFAYMARSALGTHWKSLTPAQQNRFVPLFSAYVVDTYLGQIKDSTVEAASKASGEKVRYDAPDRASVPSVVHLPSVADPLDVQYMLQKGPEGWKLYDIVVDNVSTMASYRDQFNRTMNSGGLNKLMAQLKQSSACRANRANH